MNLVYDVAHNIAKVEKHKVAWRRTVEVVVHRKGATRAFPANRDLKFHPRYRDLGTTCSYFQAQWVLRAGFLLGQPNSMDLSFGSTAHGAGRTMSRSKASTKLH